MKIFARIVDADPQVATRQRRVLSDREAAEACLTLVQHAGGNQAECGLAVEATAKGFGSPRNGMLESVTGTVIQPEDA